MSAEPPPTGSGTGRVHSAQPVLQEDPTGCGLACVAALTGRSYAAVKSVAADLGIAVSDPRLWSSPAPVRRLLRHLGLRPGRWVPFRSWTGLPDHALLAIKWHQGAAGPVWHWVVFVRRAGRAAVLDSKRSLRQHARTDFGRMQPKWFLAVAGPTTRRRGSPAA